MLGYIYKLTPLNSEYFYIGSTDNYVKRKISHKHSSKSRQTDLYKTIKECGDFEMIVLYEFECENNRELKIEEQKWIDKLKPQLNMIEAFNSDEDRVLKAKEYKQQYYQVNKDEIINERKKYYENNRDDIIMKHKDYYEVNKDDLKQKQRQYYQDNKEALLEKKKIKCVCECGVIIRKDILKQHQKTKKHIERMKLII